MATEIKLIHVDEKSLRIGNLVYGIYLDHNENNQQTVCRISGIDENAMLGEGWRFMCSPIEKTPFDIEEWEDMGAIPLTDEWLKNSGVKSLDGVWKFGPLTFKAYGGWWLNGITKPMQRQIKYVHQLQNLYFALTGEELNFEP